VVVVFIVVAVAMVAFINISLASPFMSVHGATMYLVGEALATCGPEIKYFLCLLGMG